MPNLVYSVADYVAFTKIKSADVNARFTDIKTLLNTTKLDSTNVRAGGLTADRLASGANNGFITNSATGVPTQSADAALPFHVESADPATPSSGYLKLYSKNSKLFTKNDAGSVVQVGAGSSGSINYIGNPDAEADTSGWAQYNDAFAATISIASPGVVSATAHGLHQDEKLVLTTSGALPTGLTAGTTYYVIFVDANSFRLAASLGGAAINTSGTQSGTHTVHPLQPIDGTAGTAVSTFSRTTTNPLRGTASFLLAKTAADDAGEGLSYDFSIDRADQGKVLTVSFDYTVDSNYVDSDMQVFIYDKTNAIRIPVTPQTILGGSTTFNSFKGEFQTLVNSTSYRLCLHLASANGNAYNFKLDNVSVGPAFIPQGTPITDWAVYTPTLGAGFGTATGASFFYKREGDLLRVHGRFVTGTVAASLGTITLPPGLALDTAKLATPGNTSGQAGDVLGHYTSSSNSNGTIVTCPGTSTAQVYLGEAYSASASSTPDNVSNFLASSSTISVSFAVPIAGWSASTQMSSDADTRVVAAGAYLSTNTAVTSAVIWDSKFYDTHSAFNTSTGEYVCPVPGVYRVHGYITPTTNANLQNYLYRNGVQARIVGGSTNTDGGAFSTSIKCAVGDRLSIVMGAITLVGSADGSNSSVVFFERLSGPAQIAASETVASEVGLASNYAVTANNPIIYDTVFDDTHGSYSLLTGLFTAASAGRFHVSVVGYCAASSPSLSVYVNGVIKRRLFTSSSGSVHSGAQTFKLNVGDTLGIYSDTTCTMGGAAAGPEYLNTLSIERIGL